MGTLWSYYRIVVRGIEGGLRFRLTGEANGRIFGLEVDESGKAVRNGGGELRFHVFERTGIDEMRPLALFSGRLMPADVLSGKDALEPV